MARVDYKAYGKINLTLCVTGVSGGYHTLDTVVLTVSKYNKIILKSRRDDKILITFGGKYGVTPKKQADTNAYKAAKAFIDKFKTKGVDIELIENIPAGGGMGGSSADIAGVLNGLKKLYKIDGDVKDIADSLGSDSGYLLTGGAARLFSRGENIKKIDSKLSGYVLVIYAKSGGVSTKECFEKFDELKSEGVVCDNDETEKLLAAGDISALRGKTGNALYEAACALNPEIAENLAALKDLSPVLCGVTGSGSTVFCMFDTYELTAWALWKLKRKFYGRIEILEIIDASKKSRFKTIKSPFSPITEDDLKN